MLDFAKQVITVLMKKNVKRVARLSDSSVIVYCVASCRVTGYSNRTGVTDNCDATDVIESDFLCKATFRPNITSASFPGKPITFRTFETAAHRWSDVTKKETFAW